MATDPVLQQVQTTIQDIVREQLEKTIRKLASQVEVIFDPGTFNKELQNLLICDAGIKPFSWGLNRQYIRGCIFLHLLRNLPFEAFIETGTSFGHTSLLIAAQTQLKVMTCEIDRLRYSLACRLLKAFEPRVQVVNEDSPVFLDRILRNSPAMPLFFYLDAHWYELPLVKELEIILERVPDYIIAIDDFRVPDDPGFAFDCYPNARLEWELISPTVDRHGDGSSAWYPAYPSQSETGLQRGFVLLSSKRMTPHIETLVPPHLLSIRRRESR